MTEAEIPKLAAEFLTTRFPAKVAAESLNPAALLEAVWAELPQEHYTRRGNYISLGVSGFEYYHWFHAAKPSPESLQGIISENLMLFPLGELRFGYPDSTIVHILEAA